MDRRLKFRQGLSTLYLPYYDGLCSILGPEWQPYDGARTFVEQAAMYLKGRETPGPIVTKSKAGQSAHNYGCATDWCLWEAGRPSWPEDAELWRPYILAIEKVQLRWGGDWNGNKISDERFRDFPHNELLLDCSWNHILIAYNQGGMTAAQQHIESNL